MLHLNDYPADPPAPCDQRLPSRSYPGDGVAPLSEILQTVREAGFRGALLWSCSTPTTGEIRRSTLRGLAREDAGRGSAGLRLTRTTQNDP